MYFSLLTFWCLDALLQVFIGIDLFGYPYEARHITGMFYPKNTIAHICAGLSPLYFEFIRQKYPHFKPAVLLIIPLFAVILLSGRRATWIMLAVSCGAYVYYLLHAKSKVRFSSRQLCFFALLIALSMSAIIVLHGPTQQRISTTLGLFSADYQTINKATAKRLPLWTTSVRMAKANWLNGVGPRGYRHAYSTYADADDEWKADGQTHPHQLVLEVLTESGLIGLLGLLVFVVVFIRFVIPVCLHPHTFPLALAVCVVIFPINTHMAFYGAYWSSFFWLLLALLFVAVVHGDDGRKEP